MEKFDIVVIGGGLAGLSTALTIKKEVDSTLLLVERNKIGDPSKTSPFTFPDIIQKFNLSDAVLQQYKRFTYKSPTGVTASFQYENPAFVTIDYQEACNIILNQIRKYSNVKILERTSAVDLEVTKASSKLTLSNSTSVSGSIMVDASGSSFFIPRKLGVKLPALYSHSYGEFLEGCTIEDPEEMCIFAGNKFGNGGGWMYPIDSKITRFGFATVTDSTVFPKDIVKRNFGQAVKEFYPYNKMLANAKCQRSEFGTIPIGPLKKFVYDSILIVGDAAGQATPWYNEGIRSALENGQLCGTVIAEVYKKGILNKALLGKYQQFWDAKNRDLYHRTTLDRLNVYYRTQEQWDNSVKLQASFASDEMLAIIRYGKWPTFRLKSPTAMFKSVIRKICDKMKVA